MNPIPFAELNHFAVPCSFTAGSHFSEGCSFGCLSLPNALGANFPKTKKPQGDSRSSTAQVDIEDKSIKAVKMYHIEQS